MGLTAIIGAGPHGLAAAAHLRGAGASVQSFGKPLEFWLEHMPAGMMLRSRKRSSNISDPRRELTIDRYEAATGRKVHAPNLSLAEFIDYGLWFAGRVVPDVDERRVAAVRRADGGFALDLEDGERVDATRVVVAAGLAPFPARPALFAGLPRALVSHSCDHADLAVFAGQRVIVVGAGQSALESAALLREHDAEVEVLARVPSIRWLSDDDLGSPSRLYPPTDVGGLLNGWIAAAPDVFRRLPQALQPRVAYRCIRPAGSGWLRPRLQGVTISPERYAVGAEPSGEHIRLVLDDGSERVVDHVLLGTGYQVDVRRYDFLAPELAGEMKISEGYPLLGPGLESSVPGLHFVGAPAALSFGPIMRFVVGSWYDAPALTAAVLGRRQRPVRFSF